MIILPVKYKEEKNNPQRQFYRAPRFAGRLRPSILLQTKQTALSKMNHYYVTVSDSSEKWIFYKYELTSLELPRHRTVISFILMFQKDARLQRGGAVWHLSTAQAVIHLPSLLCVKQCSQMK